MPSRPSVDLVYDRMVAAERRKAGTKFERLAAIDRRAREESSELRTEPH